ncbi:MAG: efflux RND transporter periplasmic adaptor subunit [Gammaproteobacteria bacterium]
MTRVLVIITVGAMLAACEQAVEEINYRTGEVVQRDIVVSVEAAGVIEPFLTVEVKSKASGEILGIPAETGDVVQTGTLLVKIDKRVPRNQLAQAEARLEAAQARKSIAEAQSKRARTLFASRTINEVDYEQTVLELANAKADVIGTRVDMENAQIALEDTDVRAPINGTVIEKLVEQGQVISSPTMDVGGGTLLLKMADLSQVQVKTLVDETDIGKIQPGLPVTVTVTSYPNQPFQGEVLKVEPQAMAEQTVTTFSVLMVLNNANGLLRPGMNADVEIRVAERMDALAVPTAALRTTRDIPVASQLMGLTPDTVRQQLGSAEPADAGGSGAPPGSQGYQFATRYWVFVQNGEQLRAVNVETGLTDLDYSEVKSGVAKGDTVVLLPSSGLVQSQQRLQDRMRQFTALPGMGGKKKDDAEKDK